MLIATQQYSEDLAALQQLIAQAEAEESELTTLLQRKQRIAERINADQYDAADADVTAVALRLEAADLRRATAEAEEELAQLQLEDERESARLTEELVRLEAVLTSTGRM